ncbi:hypothetical protein V5799_008546 [Amblyomma americanum]|uniref:Palmitoyltransferase n=1 Tax=Amblyomma americanum TaxID=6943 RepID=A0AAQ4FEL7_AMBAM
MPPLAGFLLRRSSATDWLPVIAALATFCWAYYAYVHVFCPSLVKDDVERFSLVSLFLLLLSLALWSFLRAITASIPPVPKRYYVSPGTRSLIEDSKTFEERKELMEALSATRGILTRANDGSVRYCDKCGLVKPDRCHHCSSCKRCIPKMDHHCPWLNNCVCFSSYKFFLLTLLYVALLAVFTFVTTSSYAWDAASTLELTAASLVHIGFLAVLGGALTLLVAGFFSVHMRLVYKNETTLEGMRADTFAEPEDSFDIGSFKNFTQDLYRAANLTIDPCRSFFDHTCYAFVSATDDRQQRVDLNTDPVDGSPKTEAGRAIAAYYHACVLSPGDTTAVGRASAGAIVKAINLSKNASVTSLGLLTLLIDLSLQYGLPSTIEFSIGAGANLTPYLKVSPRLVNATEYLSPDVLDALKKDALGTVNEALPSNVSLTDMDQFLSEVTESTAENSGKNSWTSSTSLTSIPSSVFQSQR